MSIFSKDKVKLQALEYAEKNKIVNQKSINAYIDGFNMRDNSEAEINLKSVEKVFQSNYDSWEDECGYSAITGSQYNLRKLEGYEALQIAESIRKLISDIKDFNKKYKKHY